VRVLPTSSSTARLEDPGWVWAESKVWVSGSVLSDLVGVGGNGGKGMGGGGELGGRF